MYSLVENPLIHPSEIRLKERNLKIYITCTLIVFSTFVLLYFQHNFIIDERLLLTLLPIGTLLIIIHELIIFSEELFHRHSRYKGSIMSVAHACFSKNSFIAFVLLIIYYSAFLLFAVDHKELLKLTPFCLFSSLILGAFESIRTHSNGALNVLLKENLPQIWADGAFGSFYSEVLKDFEHRVSEFERKHSVSLTMKKLILIVPLSCNVSGTFDDYYSDITYVDDLPPIVIDQGANMNRRYKNPVYKITLRNGTTFHLAMEQPSSILTICKMKGLLSKDILRYQRDLFISKLQEYFEGLPGIILLYDDVTRGALVPLPEFLSEKITQWQSNVRKVDHTTVV